MPRIPPGRSDLVCSTDVCRLLSAVVLSLFGLEAPLHNLELSSAQFQNEFIHCHASLLVEGQAGGGWLVQAGLSMSLCLHAYLFLPCLSPRAWSHRLKDLVALCS